jgi:3-hydroxyisobutyrate dehydrogenase-like beta-hydroxyacid dehydrogenase
MPDEQATPPVVGVLYAGELGSALGRALGRAGFRVVTTLEGRGPRSRRHCQEAGLEVLASLRDVARAADVVFSAVPPAAAREVAASYACCGPAPRRRVYVDLNSVAPQTAAEVARALTPTGMDFVDGAVHGLAARLPERGTVYLSGPAAARVASLLSRCLRVRVLGEVPGTASTFKMLLAGLNKGVVALFLEMALAARQAGLLDVLLACGRESYPGVLDVVERTLPTYPRHAGRRADEMAELERTLQALGLRPALAGGARRLLDEMSRLGLAGARPEGAPETWSVREVVEEAHARGLLRTPSDNTPGAPPRRPGEKA